MAYDEAYAKMLYDPAPLVAPRPKARELMGRVNARGPDLRHVGCTFTKRHEYRLKPLRRKTLHKSAEIHKQEVEYKKKLVRAFKIYLKI